MAQLWICFEQAVSEREFLFTSIGQILKKRHNVHIQSRLTGVTVAKDAFTKHSAWEYSSNQVLLLRLNLDTSVKIELFF